MNIFVKTVFLLQMQNVLIAQNLEDIDYVTEAVDDLEDTTDVEELVVTTPMTIPVVQTTSAEPLIEDDLILTRGESEADTVLLDPPAETEDNLELNSIPTTPPPTASSSESSDDEAAAPRLAVDEDVDTAEVGTPRLIEDETDTIEVESEPPKIENVYVEADIADIPEISVEENVEIDEVDEVDVAVPKLPGGWFYFSKPGVSPLYQTVQNFPRWKSGYQQMPWLYHRRWPVRPLLTNEVGEDTGYNTKLSPSYPFYAFRKISH